jgi:hypothetical protein
VPFERQREPAGQQPPPEPLAQQICPFVQQPAPVSRAQQVMPDGQMAPMPEPDRQHVKSDGTQEPLQQRKPDPQFWHDPPPPPLPKQTPPMQSPKQQSLSRSQKAF